MASRRSIFIAIVIALATAAILYWMGRSPIAASGVVKFWAGEVHGPDNSQHIADWYVFSHIIHGFLFAWLGIKLLPNSSVGTRLCFAVAIEASWELLENSPIIINRYREATASFGYSGDSILNSMADIGWMVLGFAVARRIGFWNTVIIAVVFELFTLWMIRDNLTLNILMLAWPIDAIREWQAGI